MKLTLNVFKVNLSVVQKNSDIEAFLIAKFCFCISSGLHCVASPYNADITPPDVTMRILEDSGKEFCIVSNDFFTLDLKSIYDSKSVLVKSS